jgi:hypothetical protein
MKSSARSRRVVVSADGRGLVSQAGAVLLWETLRVTGLRRGLSAALERWRAPRAVHYPGKIVADLAAALALGGDCLADVAVLREQPALAGPVASDPGGVPAGQVLGRGRAAGAGGDPGRAGLCAGAGKARGSRTRSTQEDVSAVAAPSSRTWPLRPEGRATPAQPVAVLRLPAGHCPLESAGVRSRPDGLSLGLSGFVNLKWLHCSLLIWPHPGRPAAGL